MLELLKKHDYIYWRDAYFLKALEEAKNESSKLREDLYACTFIKTVINERRNDILGNVNPEIKFGETEISLNIMVCFFIFIMKLSLVFTDGMYML